MSILFIRFLLNILFLKCFIPYVIQQPFIVIDDGIALVLGQWFFTIKVVLIFVMCYFKYIKVFKGF